MECEYAKRKKCDSLYIERYNKLLKENEELKSIIKTKDEGIKAFTEDLCYTTKQLELSNSNLLKSISINNELQNRIDKAIEYIEEDIKANYFKRYDEETYKICDELLNILKGE